MSRTADHRRRWLRWPAHLSSVHGEIDRVNVLADKRRDVNRFLNQLPVESVKKSQSGLSSDDDEVPGRKAANRRDDGTGPCAWVEHAAIEHPQTSQRKIDLLSLPVNAICFHLEARLAQFVNKFLDSKFAYMELICRLVLHGARRRGRNRSIGR